MEPQFNFTIIHMYAIYDRKGEKYDIPFFAHSDLFAKRKFTMMVQEKGTILQQFKNDFDLVGLGSVNIVTGEVKELKKTVIEGTQIKREEKEENEISNEA